MCLFIGIILTLVGGGLLWGVSDDFTEYTDVVEAFKSVGIVVQLIGIFLFFLFGVGVKYAQVDKYEPKIQCLEMSGKIDSGSCIIKNTKFEFSQLADLKKAIDLKKVVDKITEGN